MGKCILLKSGSGDIDPDELTATKEDILVSKIAGIAGHDEPTSGTMPNRGAVTQSLNCGNSYTIPSGYHNGSGKVTANSLASQTSANATAGQILSGQTAWVNGSKITGSMSNRGAVSQGLGINGSYTIPAGYHNGNGKVTQSIPVQGGSTTTPGTANKTIVAANRYVNGNIIVAGSSNLTAGNIKKGVNIFGVTGTWEGYIATAQDIYKYGINNGSFKAMLQNASHSYARFESNQINVWSTGWTEDYEEGGHDYWRYPASITTQKAYNLTGYSTITMTYYVYQPCSGSRSDIRLGICDSNSATLPSKYNLQYGGSTYLKTTGQKTITYNCAAENSTKYISFYAGAEGDNSRIGIYVYQISLS